MAAPRIRLIANSPHILTIGFLLLILLNLAGHAGCRPGGSTGQVYGSVMLDGKPLEKATVTFESLDGKSISYGITDAQGNYRLQTGNSDGVPVGEHRVRIETYSFLPGPDGQPLETPEILPPKYHAESEITRQVVAGSQKMDFELTSDRRSR